MNVFGRSALALLCGLAFALGTAAGAQRVPEKPMRIIVPFTPGAFNDTLARVLAQKFQESWGQTVVVDNRPGGATLTGGEAAAKSAPDGHTLFIVAFPFAVAPSLYSKMPHDTLKDFVPVSFAAQSTNLLVVNPKLPVHSVKDLIANAKANPGKLSYGSTGRPVYQRRQALTMAQRSRAGDQEHDGHFQTVAAEPGCPAGVGAVDHGKAALLREDGFGGRRP